MSIMNIFVRPRRVLIGVDTNLEIVNGQTIAGAREGSKVLCLPHAGVAFACRGPQRALAEVFIAALVNPEVPREGFDWIRDWLSIALEPGLRHVSAEAMAAGFSEADANNIGLAVAGYSLQAGQMQAIHFLWDGSALSSALVDPWLINYAADWNASNPPPAIDTQNGMLDAANYQVRHAQANHPRVFFGGRLLLLELTREGHMIRSFPLQNAGAPSIAEERK